MNSDTFTMADVFSKGELIQYHLPCCQRGHTWRQEQWDDLLVTSGASMTSRGRTGCNRHKNDWHDWSTAGHWKAGRCHHSQMAKNYSAVEDHRTGL